MKRPNILIVMVDQLSGTFFPDGAPADFLHVLAGMLGALVLHGVRTAIVRTRSPTLGTSSTSLGRPR